MYCSLWVHVNSKINLQFWLFSLNCDFFSQLWLFSQNWEITQLFWVSKYKTKYINFLYNSELHFYFAILTLEHAVVSYKERIVKYKLIANSIFFAQNWILWEKKSELQDINLQLREKKLNCEFISHNSETKFLLILSLAIVSLYHAILRKKGQN